MLDGPIGGLLQLQIAADSLKLECCCLRKVAKMGLAIGLEVIIMDNKRPIRVSLIHCPISLIVGLIKPCVFPLHVPVRNRRYVVVGNILHARRH